MRVPTANVIVGFDREVMSRFFSGGSTYKNLIKELTKSGELDKVLLFSNESNPNFISFEHSLIGRAWNMKLVFIDPKGEFERRFFSDNIPKNIAGYYHNDKKHIGADALKVDTDPLAKQAAMEIKQSQKLYDKKFYASLKKDLVGYYGDREFFVAYGTGDNLDLWSGPHRTVMTNADITMKGSKKISLVLTPQDTPLDAGTRRGAYNEKVDINLAGLTTRFSGFSKPIKFINLLQGERAYDPLSYLGLESLAVSGINGLVLTIKKNISDTADTFEKIGLTYASKALGDYDFHAIIIDALRSYIQKATGNPNVIMLFPNINVTCRQHINELLTNRAHRHQLDPALSGQPSLGTYYPALENRKNETTNKLGYQEDFMSTLLSSFGLDIRAFDKNIKAIPTNPIAAKADIEKCRDADKRFLQYFIDQSFYAIAEKSSNKGIPNHMEIINTIIDKINKNSKEDYQIRLSILTETDINVLDFWGGSIEKLPLHKFPTFGGYRDFNEQREAIIVGDQALIQQYLYGKVDLDNKFKNIQEYEDFASKSKENQNKYGSASEYMYSEILADVTDEEFEAYKDAEAGNYIEGKTGALKAIPLHPTDAIILTSKSYNKAIQSIINPPAATGMGAFGNASYIPDAFSYSNEEFTTDKKDYIKENGIPIFKYNTENPNVLDMTFKFGGVYYTALKMGSITAVKKKASAVAAGYLPIGIGSLPIRTRNDAIKYLRQLNFSLGSNNRDEIIASLKGKISAEHLEDFAAANPAEAADSIAALIDLAEDGSDADLRGLIEIDQGLPGNPQTIMVDLAEEMFRNSLTMSIKTLPFFNISNVHHFFSPSVLFAQEALIKQSIQPKRSLMNSFFSGLYQIAGFKHIINATTASSEFSLVKNAPSYSPVKKEDTE